MSLDKLAIIFFIIILPITVVLNAYTSGQIETLNLQISYDNKLRNATYDAVKAFQSNTINSSTSDLANSKIRDIEASINAFFSSVSLNFNTTGYNTETLREYVPAIVYTMYDGYYIYSSYTNKIEDSDAGVTYKNDQKLYGLKPFIYYSCEYKGYPKLNDDFVITYSLDNYITIQGIVNGNWVNDSGYLISNVKNVNDNQLEYRNITIGNKQNLMSDYLIRDDGNKKEYKYQKINGVKYYYDDEKNSWFSILNGVEQQSSSFLKTDSSAYNYYKEAYYFTDKVLNTYKLDELTGSYAVNEEGERLNDENGQPLLGTYKVFDENNIEEPNSNFNKHRLAVIRHTIEKNLSISIANYNNYTNVKTDFRMPKLKEDEWDRILNNISVISFMQGLDIGGKVYNGYAIVTNNNNEEVVSENSIYIATTDDGKYHNILENNLNNRINDDTIGIFNMDLQRKSKELLLGTQYYYPKQYLADYDSVVYQTNLSKDYNGNIYEYLNGKDKLAKIYYTALGRERYSMYKVNKNVQELLEKYR